MIERFENLLAGISHIYKQIRRLKKEYMGTLGMKGTHVMCLHYLSLCPEGLTAADLCERCGADKAGISRILSELEAERIVTYDFPAERKKYRARAVLTGYGRSYARRVTNLILEATKRAGEGITEEEREVFYRVLFRISGNLDQLCAELEQREENVKK